MNAPNSKLGQCNTMVTVKMLVSLYDSDSHALLSCVDLASAPGNEASVDLAFLSYKHVSINPLTSAFQGYYVFCLCDVAAFVHEYVSQGRTCFGQYQVSLCILPSELFLYTESDCINYK